MSTAISLVIAFDLGNAPPEVTMKIHILCILTGVALFMAACNQAPSESTEPKEETKASEPKEEAKASAPKSEGADKVAGLLNGKLIAASGDAALKEGVGHYVFFHSASW